jgi:hypothetical protein
MVEYSRRAMLLGSGLALGSAAIGTSAVGSVAADAAPLLGTSSGTRPITQYGNPTQIAMLVPKTSGTTMQQVELAPTGDLFMSQTRAGSGPGLMTTVVSRYPGPAVSSTRNPELDAMWITDGGHGLGLHLEAWGGGRYFVWLSLQGPYQEGDPNGGRLARFRYTPGVFTIDAIPGGVRYLHQFPNASGQVQESIYNFDWTRNLAVERQFMGSQETFTRRRITDIVLGIDRPQGRIVVPVNPPTLQGFTTVNNTFFRWVGVSNSGSGAPVPSDPMAMEQYDWSTGAKTAEKAFPTLAQGSDGTWRDGAYEPEGCSTYRERDGSASLLVGVTTGGAGDHQWPVFTFAGIGSA